MRFSRHTAGLVALVLVVAGAVVWVYSRAHTTSSSTPAWTDPQQPPAGTAGMPVASVAASYAAARPPGLCAPCTGISVGATARLYPPSLALSGESFIRDLP